MILSGAIEAFVGACQMDKVGRHFNYSASQRDSSLSTRVVSLWTLITLGLALGVMPFHYNGVYEP